MTYVRICKTPSFFKTSLIIHQQNHGEKEASPGGDGMSSSNGGGIGCVCASAIAGVGTAGSWIELQSKSSAASTVCSFSSSRSTRMRHHRR